MEGTFIIFLLSLLAYIPLASVLLYVWWKYGKGEVGISIARTVFLAGSFLLIFVTLFV
jgi:hypothetical protein